MAEEPEMSVSKKRKRPIGFGVVGCGMGAETHAWAFQRMNDAKFVAVFGRNAEKAAAFASKHGAARHYSDYAAFCADGEIDCVVIVTPNGTHAEYAVPAARQGKHLVVEKPLETTLEKGLAIARAAKESGVVLTGIYQMRFCEATKKIEAAIAGGELGTLVHCDVYDKEYRAASYYSDDHWWAGREELAGGGCLTTQSSHTLDLMHTFMGDAKSVFAKARTAVHDIEVEDICSAVITFQSGATGVVNSATCISPAFKHRVEVHGTKGTVIMNGEYDEIFFWATEKDKKPDGTAAIDDFARIGVTDIVDPHFFPMDRHIANLQDAIAAIRGEKKAKLDADMFLRSELLRFAIYESAKTGKEVTLDYSKIDLSS